MRVKVKCKPKKQGSKIMCIKKSTPHGQKCSTYTEKVRDDALHGLRLCSFSLSRVNFQFWQNQIIFHVYDTDTLNTPCPLV